MRIRDYTPADLDALRRMHAAQGFGYPFPDLESPLFIAKLVLEEDANDEPGALQRDAPSFVIPREARNLSVDFAESREILRFQESGGLHRSPKTGPRSARNDNAKAFSANRKACPADGLETRVEDRKGRNVARGREELTQGSRITSHQSPVTLRGRSGQASHERRSTDHEPRIVMAVLLRLTAETYLLHDPDAGTPRQRWQQLLALHEAARRTAIAKGLDDVQAFLPPRIARAFGRRLARLGWTQDPWPCFSRRVP